MGGFPCECCQQPECVCLTRNDLPEITIAGFSPQPKVPPDIFDWKESGECCWKRTFVPTTTPNWTCASYPLQSYEWSHTCQSKSYTWLNYLPPVFQGNVQVPCPLPTWFCCPPDTTPVPVGTTNAVYSFKGSVVFFLVYRVWKVEVYLTRKILTCGNEQVCKYVLASKYFYEYKTKAELYSKTKVSRLGTVNLNCFSKHPSYDYNSINEPNADENGWVGSDPKSCQDVDDTFISNMTDSGVFSFDRIRLFDTMPTGNVLLNNSNVLYSLPCQVTMSTLCLTQLNQDTQVCIYTPTIDDVEDNPNALAGTPPCWCNMTENPLSTEPSILANRCNYFAPIGQPRIQYQIYYCDSGGIGIGLDPGETTCIILQGGCDDTKPPCSTYNQQCAPTDWVSYPSTNCLQTFAPDSVGMNKDQFGHIISKFDCGCDPYFVSGPGNPYELSPIFAWSATCQPGNCGSCCSSLSMQCPECEAVNPYKCYQAYLTTFGASGLPMIRTIDSKELTWSCSGVTQYNQCINAPSWTIIFPS
jgi:hypothetical protein